MTVKKPSEEALLTAILDEFKPMTRVKRPTNYMDEISAYLKKWGLDHGHETTQDAVGNIIIEVPATKGYEHTPLTILQAHMDMVCVSEDPNWDQLVELRTIDGNLYATNTSMGGDDALGIAMAMVLAESEEVVHGPLRLIFTVNEEGGSPSGVGNLDPRYAMDAAYMVNLDSEDYAQVTVAACGFSGYMFRDKLCWEKAPAEGMSCFELSISGLLGGHSGVDIHKNRANAIKTLNYCLAWAHYNGIGTQLCSFTGGSSMASVPQSASVRFLLKSEDLDKLLPLLEKTRKEFAAQFDRTEAGYSFSWGECDMPEKALSAKDSRRIIDLISALRDGVVTLSQRYPGVTESSFNLGQIRIVPESDDLMVMMPMRIMSKWPALQANMHMDAIARAYGFTIQVTDEPNMGWQEREGDVLAQYYAQAFKEYTGEDCLITAVHGGLECAGFAEWNKELQIISVGPDIEGPHSTNEHVPIHTIAPTAGAIATLLGYIARGELA